MTESRMLKPALIGGVLVGILSSLPLISMFNCFCCAWVIAGGVVAARFYVKDSPLPVSLGSGVAIGLLTGIIGALVSTVFSIPLRLMMGRGGMNAMQQLKEAMDQIPNVPEETRRLIESWAASDSMGTVIFIFGTIFALVLFGIFGMVGGAIGVAVFEKRKPGSVPEEFPRYQPPSNMPPPPPPDGM